MGYHEVFHFMFKVPPQTECNATNSETGRLVLRLKKAPVVHRKRRKKKAFMLA